jgi:hypothetical protein
MHLRCTSLTDSVPDPKSSALVHVTFWMTISCSCKLTEMGESNRVLVRRQNTYGYFHILIVRTSLFGSELDAARTVGTAGCHAAS